VWARFSSEANSFIHNHFWLTVNFPAIAPGTPNWSISSFRGLASADEDNNREEDNNEEDNAECSSELGEASCRGVLAGECPLTPGGQVQRQGRACQQRQAQQAQHHHTTGEAAPPAEPLLDRAGLACEGCSLMF